MTFRGHIQNGRVEFDQPVDLPEGLEIDVHLRKVRAKPTRSVKKKPAKARRKGAQTGMSAFDALRPFIGAAKDLPADWARNLDHYLYGTPKR